MKSRLERLREKMKSEAIPALFIFGTEQLRTSLENLRYLTGFTGTSGHGLVTMDSAYFFADPRYHLQAKSECAGFEVVQCTSRVVPEAVGKIKELGIDTLSVEKDYLTLGQQMNLQDELSDVTLQPTEGYIADLRLVKEPEEVEAIREACKLVDRCYEHALTFIKEGITERDLAIEIDFFLRRNGAADTGFDSIVAFGPHSAHPHARPTDRKLERNQFIKMDFGAYMNAYNSDITRTVFFGAPEAKRTEIYEVVLEAQRRALETLKPGIPGKEVDAAARDYIKERGYGEQFGHGLGHGLGRDVHDGGSLNPLSEIAMEPGQVWTIEPGVYLEGFGGVRIEDDVVVTDSGCEILTSAPKRFTVLG